MVQIVSVKGLASIKSGLCQMRNATVVDIRLGTEP